MKIHSSDILSKLRDVRDARIEGRDQSSIDNDYWLQGYTKAINDIIALEKAERVDEEEDTLERLYKHSESVAYFTFEKDPTYKERVGFKTPGSNHWTLYIKDEITFGAVYFGRWEDVLSKYSLQYYTKLDGVPLNQNTSETTTITVGKVYQGDTYGMMSEL